MNWIGNRSLRRIPPTSCSQQARYPLISLITDSCIEVLQNMRTSKSSLRIYRLKCFLNAHFFELNLGVARGSAALGARLSESNTFIDRYLQRAYRAERIKWVDDVLLPGQALIADHRDWFDRANVPINSTRQTFGFELSFPVISFAGAMADSLLMNSSKFTLTQLCILLALWEARLCAGRLTLTTSGLSHRLSVTKSTLSTSIEGLLELGVVRQQDHPEDGRISLFSINPENPAIQLQRRLIDQVHRSDCTPQALWPRLAG